MWGKLFTADLGARLTDLTTFSVHGGGKPPNRTGSGVGAHVGRP
jgi:hypothetical protein